MTDVAKEFISKNVGVLTLSHTCNYGAELQAYALSSAICALGHPCKVIDYSCPFVVTHENPHVPSWSDRKDLKGYVVSWLTLGERARKQRGFASFGAHHLPYSACIADEQELARHFGTVVVGSDQVWNDQVTGWDHTFYLDDFACDDLHKVAYGASLGDAAINSSECYFLRNSLAKFESISTREASGKAELEKLGIRGVRHVLDPTLLLASDEWHDIAVKPAISSPYVLAYFIAEFDETLALAKRVAAELGLPLVGVQLRSLRKRKGLIVRNAASPEEFVGLIANAEFVVTSSFHGTCFSILFEKNFRSVLKPGTDKHRSRIYELLETLGLQEACFDGDVSYEPLDYSEARIKLQHLRNESLDFLRLALAGDESVRITVEGQ